MMTTGNSTYKWIFEQSRSKRVAILALAILSSVQAALLVVFALACRAIIDAAVAGDTDGLVLALVQLGAVIIGQLVLQVVNNSIRERIYAKTNMDLRGLLLRHLITCDYVGVRKFHSGELSNRMFSDVAVVSSGITNIVPNAVAMAMQLLCVIGALVWISPSLVILFLVAAAVAMVLAYTMRGLLKKLHRDVQEKEGRARVFLQEALEHQLVIRSFGVQDSINQQADAVQGEHYRAQIRRRNYSIAANSAFSFFFKLLYLVSLAYCAWALLQGTMSYGTLMAVIQLVGRIQSPVSSLSGTLPQLYQAEASAERLIEIVSLPAAEAKLAVAPKEFYEALQGLRIADMYFSYAKDDTECKRSAVNEMDDVGGDVSGADDSEVDVQLEDESELIDKLDAADVHSRAKHHVHEAEASLSCAAAFVPRGAFVAVTGPSGSGKSTLFKLILGAFDASGLAYELSADAARAWGGAGNAPGAPDSVTVAHVSGTQVPAGTFAYVPQDGFTLSGTIRENVTFAAAGATDAEVKTACEIACAWEFIEQMPEGLDTHIGEGGEGISQGQMQRIAIARAICSGAPILVLDEATSALDASVEQRVISNIAALKDKTVFVATHRPCALDYCTAYLQVEAGRVIQIS